MVMNMPLDVEDMITRLERASNDTIEQWLNIATHDKQPCPQLKGPELTYLLMTKTSAEHLVKALGQGYAKMSDAGYNHWIVQPNFEIPQELNLCPETQTLTLVRMTSKDYKTLKQAAKDRFIQPELRRFISRLNDIVINDDKYRSRLEIADNDNIDFYMHFAFKHADDPAALNTKLNEVLGQLAKLGIEYSDKDPHGNIKFSINVPQCIGKEEPLLELFTQLQELINTASQQCESYYTESFRRHS